jgi:hypothetical protein
LGFDLDFTLIIHNETPFHFTNFHFTNFFTKLCIQSGKFPVRLLFVLSLLAV